MTLGKLPAEIVLEIGEASVSQADLLSLSRTCHRLHHILHRRLLPYDIRHNNSSGLVWAAAGNNITLAQQFVAANADVNVNLPTLAAIFPDPLNPPEDARVAEVSKKPLWTAIQYNNQEIAIFLLENGADSEIETCEVRWLLERGHPGPAAELYPAYDFPLLSHAILNRDLPMFELLLEHLTKEYPAYLHYFTNIDGNGGLVIGPQQTPLYAAIEKGHSAVVELLLDRGANITHDMTRLYVSFAMLWQLVAKEVFVGASVLHNH
ncbi:hypothetical protein BJY04DRAFT_214195 [Aspergillus karnatakaensis]|uniref:uncharacterized protein n=1 Tax=Aspergillus karnatakaensis TaxID=1810916 RepID=UPI003CCCB9AE